jgi:virulence-associated protein VapD
VYAICFDLDTERLGQNYHGANPNNAYADIRRILERHGFVNQQGSVYFGNDQTDPVRCVLAVQEVTNTYDWFRVVVRDIRMLRIEENNDLMPAVEPQGDLLGGGAPAAAE